MIDILLSEYNFHEKWCHDALKEIIKEDFKVLIVPFSFHNSIKKLTDFNKLYDEKFGKYYDAVINPFLQYKIKVENITSLNYFVDTKDTAIKKISESDLIFFTGGLPDRIMDRLKEFDLIYILESFKGILIGSSTGAMIQIPKFHISPNKDYENFLYKDGLDIIKNFDIEVHYNGNPSQISAIEKALEEKSKPIYAIENKGLLVFDDRTVSTVGKVHLFSNNP